MTKVKEEPCGTVSQKEEATIPKITEPAIDTGEPCGDNGYAGYTDTNDFSWIDTIGSIFTDLGENAASIINSIGEQKGKKRESDELEIDSIKIAAKVTSIAKDIIGKDIFENYILGGHMGTAQRKQVKEITRVISGGI